MPDVADRGEEQCPVRHDEVVGSAAAPVVVLYRDEQGNNNMLSWLGQSVSVGKRNFSKLTKKEEQNTESTISLDTYIRWKICGRPNVYGFCSAIFRGTQITRTITYQK